MFLINRNDIQLLCLAIYILFPDIDIAGVCYYPTKQQFDKSSISLSSFLNITSCHCHCDPTKFGLDLIKYTVEFFYTYITSKGIIKSIIK